MLQYSKKILPFLACTIITAILLSGCPSEQQVVRKPGKHNVILISVDTLRADHLSCYGYERKTSPSIDRLAADGVMFDKAFTAYNLTLGSITTILTGIYPLSHNVMLNGMVVPDSLDTMAEIMKEAGYATAAVVANWAIDSRYGTAQGFDQYIDDFGFKNRIEVESNWSGGHFLPDFEKRAGFVKDKALELLRTMKDDRFFLWLHFMDPHGAYDPPEEFAHQFKGTSGQRALCRQPVDDGQFPIHKQVQVPGINDFDYYVNHYDGEIAYVDHCLGEIIDYLKTEGLYDDALIVFVSDHGEFMGEADDPINRYYDSVPFFCHGMTGFDSEIRVPFLVKLPKGIVKNRIVETPVSTVDILATIAELAEIGTVSGQGHSLVPEMNSAGSTNNDKAIIGQLLGNRYYIRKGDFKLIFNFADIQPLLAERSASGKDTDFRQAFAEDAVLPPIALYNLADDPLERMNLASEERERTRQLFVELMELLVANQKKVRPYKAVLLEDEKTKEGLKNLGYIN